MRDCDGCGQSFTPEHGNRKNCYECVPKNLTRHQHMSALQAAKTKKARRLKVEQGCDICGYNRCGSALEWHHPDDNKHEHNPSNIAQYNWEKYLDEIAKCILVCANCHRESHELDERH